MESLEISGKTVEEAIQRALEQLGVSREEVEVTVVKEGRSGVWGLGADEAVIRVKPLVPAAAGKDNLAEVAKGTLEKLLSLLEVDASVTVQEQPAAEPGDETPASILLNVKGDDLGIMIGRRGYTLACLQYITRLIVGHQTQEWLPIVVDVEAYKQRRHQTLQVFARNIAEQVKVRQEPFTLEPMPPYERRIIHLALADHPHVTTRSIGMGESRKVVIEPR
ncbi:MAG: RNA-binding cell elongation regulator Jag/EloR [Dehalococcoidales bacterium]|nr:RNA-binding cell elongation regulator Jag/EloR [Dehalococcoidales bacterium]